MNIKPLLILLSITLVVVVYFACAYRDCKRLFVPKNSSIPIVSQSDYGYHSNNLNFSIKVKPSFNIKEEFNSVLLTSANGSIEISKIGTYYEVVNDYLNYLSRVNNVKIEDRKSMKINSFLAMSGIVKHSSKNNPDAKMYFISTEKSTLYTISTITPALYDDLDEIAKSFRYTP